jgi:PhnB protein
MPTESEPAAVSHVPPGYATVTPWIITDDTAAFIAFARAAFGAQERFPPIYADEAKTRVAHAEVQIGDSVLMLFDRGEGWAPTPTFLNVYVDDVDAVHQRALDAGAVEITGLSTNPWGDRGSRIRDPFGNLWWVQSHVEDVSENLMDERMEQQHYVAGVIDAMTTLDREMKRRATGARH